MYPESIVWLVFFLLSQISSVGHFQLQCKSGLNKKNRIIANVLFLNVHFCRNYYLFSKFVSKLCHAKNQINNVTVNFDH